MEYDWIEATIAKYPKARRDVLMFISKINSFSEGLICQDGVHTPIEKLFTCGFCYYFALMLKDAFGGEIVWHKGYGHILWRDNENLVYDIYGVYEDWEEGDMVPISEVPISELEDFRHRE